MKTRLRVFCAVLAAMVLFAATPMSSMAAPKVAAPRIASVKAVSASSLTVKWKKVKKAKGYEVYRSAKKTGKYKKVATLKSPAKVTYTNKKLKASTKYFYKVRAYAVTGGKKVYSKFSAPKSGKTLAKGAAAKPTPKPTPKPGATATPKPGATATPKPTATPAPTLPPGAKRLAAPNYYLNGTKFTDTSCTVDWYSVYNAEGYEIQRAQSEAGPYTAVGTTDRLLYTDQGLSPSTTYYYKVRAYATASGQRYYGALSTVQKITTLKKQPKIAFVAGNPTIEYLYTNGFFYGSRVNCSLVVTDAAGYTEIEVSEKSGGTKNGSTRYMTQTRKIPINGPGVYDVTQEIWNGYAGYADRTSFTYTISAFGQSYSRSIDCTYSSYNGAWTHYFEYK